MGNKDNNEEEELPKLNIKQENEFKKLKLAIEHGAEFLDFKSKTDLPPEIEGQFLDYIPFLKMHFKTLNKLRFTRKLESPISNPKKLYLTKK